MKHCLQTHRTSVLQVVIFLLDNKVYNLRLSSFVSSSIGVLFLLVPELICRKTFHFTMMSWFWSKRLQCRQNFESSHSRFNSFHSFSTRFRFSRASCAFFKRRISNCRELRRPKFSRSSDQYSIIRERFNDMLDLIVPPLQDICSILILSCYICQSI